MSRPMLRRALKRAGLEPVPREPRGPGPRSRGATPPPRVLLQGESSGAGPVDFAALFGRSAPLEVEIGTGRGRFLFAEAAARPGRNFLGLEVETDYVRIARLKIERLGLANVRVESVDGKAFFNLRVPPDSVSALHVFFPDPWPKKRHHKRRLFDEGFVGSACRALVPGGLFRVASDHAEYFQTMTGLLDAEAALRRLTPEEEGEWLTGTDYEKRFLASGKAYGKGIWVRR